MTEDQFVKARKLNEEKAEIKKELKIWEKELTARHKLGYLQGWNNNYPVKLHTKISEDIFNGFRCAAINDLKLKLSKIDEDFESL